VLAFCLLVVVTGAARLGIRTVERWGSFVGQNVHVIAYLVDDADPGVIRGLTELLGRVPTVTGVKVVDPAQALAHLRTVAASLGSEPKVLAGLEASYFPRSIEVSLAPAADLSERAANLAERLRAVPGVDQVDAMTGGLARLAAWVRLGRRLGAVLIAVFGLLSIAALLAVVVRSRNGAQNQAEVLLELGETSSAVRLPSSLWMCAAGLVGGTAGLLLLRVCWRPLLVRVESNLGIAASAPLPFLAGNEVAGGLAIVGLLGLVLGYFATPLPRADSHA